MRQARTLVITADRNAKEVLSVALEELGLAAIFLSGVVAALTWAEAIRPALVILDLDLRGPVAGKTLLQHVRASPRLQGTRVVAIAGGEEVGEEISALVDAVVVKPFGFEELQGSVGELVR